MPTYQAPVKDTLFVLNEVLGFERYSNLPGFADASGDMLDAILGEAAKLAENVIQPTNRDRRPRRLRAQRGRLRHHAEKLQAGLRPVSRRRLDGLGRARPNMAARACPTPCNQAVGEYFVSANMALMMYPGLTHGAIAAIHVHGTDEQKSTWLPKMVDGVWTGTMNLTEPHCGTDLGMLRTKAVPNGNGAYKISGQKIFISAGEHDMSDNIVHLVLARAEGSPEGIKGISLFIVPKFVLDADGNPGKRNGVSCGSIEEKMGIHGNSTCVMNYDEAEGYLIGELNGGMKRHVHDDERSAAGRRPAGSGGFGGRLSERGRTMPGTASRAVR